VKHRPVIGLEISGNEVRGACVRSVGGTLEIASAASMPLSSGSIDSEGLLNHDLVGEVIRRVCSQLDTKTNHVVVGITGCNLVARVMEIPPVPDSEVRAVLRGEMDHYRILPVGQSAFDFYRLPNAPEKEGTDKEDGPARVLLMGAEERLITSYRAAVDAGNLNPVAVEPGSIAVLRALYPMLRAEEAVATVMLTASGTDIFITHHGDLQFYRRVDTGIHELHLHSTGPSEDTSSQNRSGMLLSTEEEWKEQPSAPNEAREDLFNRQAISLLMTEVQRSIDFYIREFPAAGERMLVRVYIDSPDATELFGVMTQYLRSDAEMATALDYLTVAPEAVEVLGGKEAFRYTVAVGLALRGAGGEYTGAPALDLGLGDPIIVERRVAPKLMFASVGASGLILLGTMLAALLIGNNIARTNQRLAQTKNELLQLTQEHAQKVARLDRQKKLVEAIHNRDKPLREAVEFLSASISRRAWLTTMTIDNTGKIFLSGETSAPRYIADIMDKVNLSPTLEPIRLNNMIRVGQEKTGQALRFDLQTGFMSQAASPAAPSAPAARTKPTGGA
jgi:type IV pilus assembly protein PilM